MLDVPDYYTQQFADIYSEDVVDETRRLFESPALVEAFWTLHGQIDMLIEKHEVDVWGAEYREHEGWRLRDVLSAADELVTIARNADSPIWPAAAAIAAAMRIMTVTLPIAPTEDYRQKRDLKRQENATEGANRDADPGAGTTANDAGIDVLDELVKSHTPTMEIVKEALSIAISMTACDDSSSSVTVDENGMIISGQEQPQEPDDSDNMVTVDENGMPVSASDPPAP